MAVGKSLVAPNSAALCRTILEHARKLNVRVLLPIDFQVAKNSMDGTLSIVDLQSIANDDIGISIGPKTAELYAKEIKKSQTIFYNGLMGFQDRPETLQGTKALLAAMANSRAYMVIGGGDTIAIAESIGLADSLSFCSTGGGVALTYLSGQPLPGIEAIIKPGDSPIHGS